MPSKRNIRIGNVSGATGDHWDAMQRMAEKGNVDIITGDWLSEMNIAWNAIAKANDPSLGYEAGFLHQLSRCIDSVVEKGLKIITNAGALNTSALTLRVEELCRQRGHNQLVVAQVVGDDITEMLMDRNGKAELDLRHLDHENNRLDDWQMSEEVHCGVAYIGAWGIVEALNAGADIVICGRVTDASPVIGATAWWYNWQLTQFDQLAGALVAGHLIECGPYATGGNFSGFKEFLPQLVDIGFGIAEIQPDGTSFITKPEDSNGVINRFNMTSQLLYELQGELYLNPDVVADLSQIKIEDTKKPNMVYISGVVGLPPPSTTKAMITAKGGYQAETTFYINGLDVYEKAQMMKNQLEHMFKSSKFNKLSIELYGSPASNPTSQQAGTMFLRIFAQARKMENINAPKFRDIVYALRMQSYPGYHMNLDFRTMDPKPFMEMFPAVIPLQAINHEAVLANRRIPVPPPVQTAVYPVLRNSYETSNPRELSSFGITETAPLGSIVHARSGDKANNSNVGFFVRNTDEYPWLQSLLTVQKFKDLLGDDWSKGDTTRRIERCEFPNLLAVHFRILDFLDGGIASSSRVDGLGKGVGEFLRSRTVEVPVEFLGRGKI